ncbi:LuxR family transcriptional regulator [Pseudomonas cavernicola]|uniref:LuxR family transcriptional regulator n=1 Tax=Pseudomonas cavernicola TaxID=2320866 RepID=A0A418XJW3_9PSED|nr:LuxR C-terminal-related transcriptional regulator [Pseudomonas cavernicola]RJG12716.1 LuxR family transcriptional regulator [Pseudomonas cavernicola]
MTESNLPSLPLDALHAWHAGLAGALMALHSSEFPAVLCAALQQLTPIESVLISLERKGQPPLLLYECGIPLERRAALISRYYSRGYMLDPFCLAVENGLVEGFYHLSEIAPDNFFSSEYYKTYYLKTGSVEDSYYIVDLSAQSKISICLYQGLSASRFSPAQLALLRCAEPLVRQLVLQHWAEQLGSALAVEQFQAAQELPATTLNTQIAEAFMSFGNAVLTEREREISHLILRGHSAKSTARVLDISPETVRMHRKNLYAKLAVSSQAELFALFIDSIVGPPTTL